MFIIVDWANNWLFQDKEFKTFEDGWGFIYEQFPNGDEDRTFDDLFIIRKEDL